LNDEERCLIYFLRLLSIIFFIAGIVVVAGGVGDLRQIVNISIILQLFIDLLTGFFILFMVNTEGITTGGGMIGFALALEIIAFIIELYIRYGMVDNKDEEKEVRSEVKIVSYIFRFLIIIFAIISISLIPAGAQSIRRTIDLIILIQWFYSILIGFFMLFGINTAGIQNGVAVSGVALALAIIALIIDLYTSYEAVQLKKIEEQGLKEQKILRNTKKYQIKPVEIYTPEKIEDELRAIEKPINNNPIDLHDISPPSLLSLEQEPIYLFEAEDGIDYSKEAWTSLNNYDAKLMLNSKEIIIRPKIDIIPQITIRIDDISTFIGDPASKIIKIFLNNKKYYLHFQKIGVFYQFHKLVDKIRNKKLENTKLDFEKMVGEANPPPKLGIEELGIDNISSNNLNTEKILEQIQPKKDQEVAQVIDLKIGAVREYIKKITKVYDEIPLAKLSFKTNLSVEEVEPIIENMIIYGEIQAKIRGNSVFFIDETEVKEKQKKEKIREYIFTVLKIRLAKGEITEEEYERIVKKIG